MSNFLILGLPRSRTAWLANFMTIQDIHCTHEGLNGCHTLAAYRRKFTDNSGDSNTGLALFDFEALFKDFKRVIIDSDIKESVEFAKKHYDYNTFETMTRLKHRLDNLDGLHIAFNDINNQLETIWNYLTPKQYNEKRASMLIGFDVQLRNIHDIDEPAFKALVNNTHNYFKESQYD